MGGFVLRAVTPASVREPKKLAWDRIAAEIEVGQFHDAVRLPGRIRRMMGICRAESPHYTFLQNARHSFAFPLAVGPLLSAWHFMGTVGNSRRWASLGGGSAPAGFRPWRVKRLLGAGAGRSSFLEGMHA